MTTRFVSGHVDLGPEAFARHYEHVLEAAVASGDRFVVGDARGADDLARRWLVARGADVTLFHLGSRARHGAEGCRTVGGFAADDERDAAMTAASDADLCWVASGRERSGTARNLLRRGLPPVGVLRASPEDWRRVRSVRLSALADSPDAFGGTLEGESALDDEAWRRRTTRSGVVHLLAVRSLDLGLAVVAPTSDHPADLGLYGVWVHPLARGGTGDALVAAAIGVARERGAHRLVLDVGDHNGPARALYARHGFQPTGRRGHLPAPRERVTEHELALSLAA